MPVTGGADRSKSQHPADILRRQSGSLLMAYGNRLDPFGAAAILSDDAGKTWRCFRRQWTLAHQWPAPQRPGR